MSMERRQIRVCLCLKNSEMTYFISHLNVFVVKGRKCTSLNLPPICALTIEEQYACVYVTDEHTRTPTSTYRHTRTQVKTTHVRKHTYIHIYEHTPYTHPIHVLHVCTDTLHVQEYEHKPKVKNVPLKRQDNNAKTQRNSKHPVPGKPRGSPA